MTSHGVPGPTISTASVKFNYGAPETRPDGHFLIKPLFNTSPNAKVSKEERALRIAINSEVPLLMRDAGGALDAKEERDCRYFRMESERKIFVGDDQSSVFTAVWLDESVAAKNPRILDLMQQLREKILAPSSDPNCEGKAAFETLLLPGESGTRAYRGGFSILPQETDTGTASLTISVVNDPELLAGVSRMLGEVADYYLRRYVPQNELDLMDRHAEIEVPLVFGGVNYKHFSSWHMNISPESESRFSDSVGRGGEMHTDDKDDFRRWTVLLALGNLSDGLWPGRTMISDLRAYAVMAPFTVLIFKAVRPHLSLGPSPADPKRKPYVPAVSNLPQLDVTFPKLRLTIANYMKLAIANDSPALIRTRISAKFVKGGKTSNPDSLKLGLAAFGTIENQAAFHAKAFAKNRARLAVANDNVYVSNAETIAHNFGFKDHGKVRYPRKEDIERVLDGNGPETQEMVTWRSTFNRYEDICKRVLSMSFFPASKASGKKKIGAVTWVANVGSSLANGVPDMEDVDPAGIKGEEKLRKVYGENPFGCRVCGMRFRAHRYLAPHFRNSHGDEFEWQTTGPTYDNSIYEPEGSEPERSDPERPESERPDPEITEPEVTGPIQKPRKRKSTRIKMPPMKKRSNKKRTQRSEEEYDDEDED